MKKSLLFGFAALAALAFSACQKEVTVNEKEMVTVTLTAQKPGDETRTAAVEEDSKVSYVWTDEDKANLKVFVVGKDAEGKETLIEVTDRTVAISSDNKVLTVTATVEAGSKLRTAVASAWTSGNKPKINVNQSPKTDNFDPGADVLVAEDVTVDGLDEALLDFSRPAAMNKMTLKNLVAGEKIHEITITSDKTLVGYYENGAMKGQTTGGNSLTLSYDNIEVGENGEFPVYFVAMPNEGNSLTVVVKSDQFVYTKSFGTVNFTVGKFSKFGVKLPAGEPVVDTDYTGDWVITGVNDGAVYAAQAFVSGGTNLKGLGISLDKENEEITSSNVEVIKMHFTKVTEGDFAGLYTIQDASGNYLYAAAADKNQLKGASSINGADYYWSVEEESDGVFTIKAKESNNRNVMRFNPNNGNPIFSCYTSGQKDVTLYPYSWVVEEPGIQPSGSGSLEDPFNTPAVYKWVEDNLNAGETSDADFYFTGKISSIRYSFDAEHGTATFDISADGTTSETQFTCYSVYYLGNESWVTGNTQIKVGDEVIICGKLTNYNGTFETASREAYIYSLNGVTEDEPGTGSTTATIKFGSNNVKINGASVTGDDDQGNTWTITTEGTTSFTANDSYYQVGSSSKPATSIIFTTTLPEGTTKVDALSIKLGGFSGTAGDVTLEVGSTTVGTGSLNATNDVTVSSTSSADGRTITITVDNISKGVKVYNITAEYE